jgi:hypothetical protein
MTTDDLVQVTAFLNRQKEIIARRERERLEDQARAVEYERRVEEERLRLEEIRRRQQAEKDEIDRLNNIERERIRAIVYERERIRGMIARREKLPPGTVLRSLPARIECCYGECDIPKQGLFRQYFPGLEPDVIVDPNTRCVQCAERIFASWDAKAVISYRAEEQQRMDEMFEASVIVQERNRVNIQDSDKIDCLVAEASDIERHFRRAKFDRELDEARRKWAH